MSKRYEGIVWEPWLAAKKTESKAGTIDLIDRVWRIHVKPKWGMREVQSITHDEVQVWVSELAGLQVGDVDFERQRIHVLRTVSEIRDYFVVGTPKTGETRTVIFPSLLRPCLEGACKGRQSSGAPARIFGVRRDVTVAIGSAVRSTPSLTRMPPRR
ncbi:hypothetical protein [Bifidobacterium bifidum]|uniref:hypothetical protein n=1 Tax=Bifidobacterium bifidum TaxID=1681 RepID=UPI003CFDA989